MVGFHERFLEWVGRDHPPWWLQARVLEWLPTLELDPYHLATPEMGGTGDEKVIAVPDADTDGLSVVCSYWIEDDWVVRCNRIGWRDDPPGSDH